MSHDLTQQTTSSPLVTNRISLERDESGRLVLNGSDGTSVVGVVPVRAFPLSQPDRGISLVSPKGTEAAWVDDVHGLPPTSQALLKDELAAREFRPTITSITAVSTFSTPSTWSVQTTRGDCSFVLKAEEDIRRLEGSRLLITSGDGVCFEVTDRWALDRPSKRLLERFL
jgi:Domain of unknown function (DUF1854)